MPAFSPIVWPFLPRPFIHALSFVDTANESKKAAGNRVPHEGAGVKNGNVNEATMNLKDCALQPALKTEMASPMPKEFGTLKKSHSRSKSILNTCNSIGTSVITAQSFNKTRHNTICSPDKGQKKHPSDAPRNPRITLKLMRSPPPPHTNGLYPHL
jgi:hypothetical protein